MSETTWLRQIVRETSKKYFFSIVEAVVGDGDGGGGGKEEYICARFGATHWISYTHSRTGQMDGKAQPLETLREIKPDNIAL